jgi:hypothetical protein
MSDSDWLISGFVDSFLNNSEPESVARLFHSKFVDHNPIEIPGQKVPLRNAGLGYLNALRDFLHSPGVDIHFELEESFSFDRSICYRLFGEGTIDTEATDDSRGSPVIGVGEFVQNGEEMRDIGRVPRLVDVTRKSDNTFRRDGRLLGNNLHLEYHSVGIFHTCEGQLFDRWGHIVIR